MSSNPFRDLFDFADKSYREELRRAAHRAGKNRQARTVWGSHFEEKLATLHHLEDIALHAWERTGLAWENVKRPVNALADACRAILLWQRDAPVQYLQTECLEGARPGRPELKPHPLPVAQYLQHHYDRILTAWRDVRELALLIDRQPDPPKSKDRPSVTVNARMLETLQVDSGARGWTCKQWAQHLRCGKSTVAETKTWKELGMMRKQSEAERAKDRRRRPNKLNQRGD
jgi:hypothetical protein